MYFYGQDVASIKLPRWGILVSVKTQYLFVSKVQDLLFIIHTILQFFKHLSDIAFMMATKLKSGIKQIPKIHKIVWFHYQIVNRPSCNHAEHCRKMSINVSGAESGIFWENYVNTIDADALAPSIARSSATTVSIVWWKICLSSMGNDFNYLCHLIFFCFPEWIENDKGKPPLPLAWLLNGYWKTAAISGIAVMCLGHKFPVFCLFCNSGNLQGAGSI